MLTCTPSAFVCAREAQYMRKDVLQLFSKISIMGIIDRLNMDIRITAVYICIIFHFIVPAAFNNLFISAFFNTLSFHIAIIITVNKAAYFFSRFSHLGFSARMTHGLCPSSKNSEKCHFGIYFCQDHLWILQLQDSCNLIHYRTGCWKFLNVISLKKGPMEKLV